MKMHLQILSLLLGGGRGRGGELTEESRDAVFPRIREITYLSGDRTRCRTSRQADQTPRMSIIQQMI